MAKGLRAQGLPPRQRMAARLDRAPGDAGASAGADPLSDIFFGFLAVILVIVCLLIPAVQDTPGPTGLPEQLTHDGEDVTILFADAAGIVIAPDGGSQRQEVATNDIIAGEAMKDWLRNAATGTRIPFLIVAPDGHEPAFLFEALAAEAGLPEYAFTRLPDAPETCASAIGGGAMAALCAEAATWR
ncbi:MAG: hypothetical protein AAF675_07015 [Pseudomonadota bacterium]